MKKKLTIYEIAKKAKVSPASVSRVLNKKPGVQAGIRAKIQKIISDQNYSPNLLARELSSNRTGLIGIVMPNINSFFSDPIEAINDCCKENNYNIMITAGSKKNNDLENEINNIKILYQKRVEGIIIFTSQVSDDYISILQEISSEIPIISVNRDLSQYNIISIIYDNFSSSQELTDYFINNGHKDIFFITGPKYDESAMERLNGFKASLKKNKIKFDPTRILEGYFSINSGYQAIKNYIKVNNNIPESIIASNDNMAIGAIRALDEHNIIIPEKTSIAGFDNIEILNYLKPALTTINQNQYNAGLKAANILFNHLKGNIVETKKVVLEHELIIRKSIKTK